MIVIADLDVRNLSKLAKVTQEKHGKNVKTNTKGRTYLVSLLRYMFWSNKTGHFIER